MSTLSLSCYVDGEYPHDADFNCRLTQNGTVVGMIELGLSTYLTEFYQHRDVVAHNNSVRVATLTTFKTGIKGTGRPILCLALKKLREYGYTHVVLNAMPHSTGRFANRPNATKSLINYYRLIGFRLKNKKTNLMVGTVRNLLNKCKTVSVKVIDTIAMQQLNTT